MNKKKKPYEKPQLKAVKMMEVGAALCCRATAVTCSQTSRTGTGKGQRTTNSS
ncbi:MAG: hypothetical protein WDL87_00930 [Candidatus Omnitrophota bacterium]|jgi:hypothetical protein